MSGKTLLNLFISGLFYYPFLAGAATNLVSGNPVLIDSTLESAFSVKRNKVIADKADKETCKIDNAYMLSALKVRKIGLKNLDYKVRVNRKHYPHGPASKDTLEIFHYEIEFPDFDIAMKKGFPELTKTDFIKTHIPLSKAPTTCYIFTGNQKLNLLCTTGLSRIKRSLQLSGK